MTSYPKSATSTLSDSHGRSLEVDSGIMREVVTESGVASISHGRELPDGFSPRQRKLGPGLLFTVHRPNGETAYSFRPDDPDKPGRKYEQQSKRYGGPGNVLYVHPGQRHLVGDLSVPVIYVEGIKKALSIISAARRAGARVLVVAISGVWNFLSDGEPIPDLLEIPVRGRKVGIVFDSDILTNPGVQGAAVRLAETEISRGAEVRVAFLPDAPDGSKMGADDFLVAGKSYAELGMTMRPYDPGDFEVVRLTRDDRLRALVEYLRSRWWAEEWKGRGGHSDRDIALVLTEAASKSGKIHADGLRVEMSWGVLQVRAKVSRRTLAKALARLEERGFLYRDNSGRKTGKSGAFVLRAKVDQYGRRAETETTEVRECDPRGLHLRPPLAGVRDVPRMRWTQPKFMPRRGTVAGTRKVRESKPPAPRDRIERLGKIRGAVVDALYAAGGSCTLLELCEVLHRSRPRDLRRRVLPMLEEAGIIEAANDTITLAADWSERLEAARGAGGEMDADEKAEGDRKRKSRAYRARDSVKPDRHHANAGADGHVEDLRPAEELATPPGPEFVRPDVSPLAAAVRGYLDRCPHDARRSPYWIGATLWAHDLHHGKPTQEETRAAIEELGGAAYLEGVLRRARGAA